jgi:twitching motility two-component system response regulator PilG
MNSELELAYGNTTATSDSPTLSVQEEEAQASMPDFAPPAIMAQVTQLLTEGIHSAKSGNRQHARELLHRATSLDGNNETAWMWLASISEHPEELLEYLQKVLYINPDNERALEWQRATKSLLAKSFVQKGIASAKENQKPTAAGYFRQAINFEPNNELAWLWLASVSDALEDKMAHLQKVLLLNPDNEKAISSMNAVRRQMARMLVKKASGVALSGDRQTAFEILENAMEFDGRVEEAWLLQAFLAERIDEKISALEKALEINPHNAQAQANLHSLKDLISEPIPTVEDTTEEMSLEESLPVELDEEQVVEQPSTNQLLKPEEQTQTPVQAEQQETVVQEYVSNPYQQDYSANCRAENYEAEAEQDYSATEQAVVVEEVSAVSAQEQEDDILQDVFEEEQEVEEVAAEQQAEFVAEYQEEVEYSTAQQQYAADYYETEPQTAFEQESEETSDYYTETQQTVDFYASESDRSEQHYVTEQDQPEQHYVPVPEESNGFYAAEQHQETEEYSFHSQPTIELQASETVEFESSEYVHTQAEDESQPQYSEQTDEVESAQEYAEQNQEQSENFAELAEQGFAREEQVEDLSASLGVEQFELSQSVSRAESFICPICKSENEQKVDVCRACKVMLNLDNCEQILIYDGVDEAMVRSAIQRMRNDKPIHDFSSEDFFYLGMAYLSLKDWQNGVQNIQHALRLNPTDVALNLKVNALVSQIETLKRETEVKSAAVVSAGKIIMVVDDSPTVRKLITSKLEKQGHQVIAAVDGMDALAKMNEQTPDLILLDITMPRLDGYQVCKLVRGNAATKNVPVVMISGKDGFFDKVRGRMAGSTAYITKPFGPETLIKTVETYCQ